MREQGCRLACNRTSRSLLAVNSGKKERERGAVLYGVYRAEVASIHSEQWPYQASILRCRWQPLSRRSVPRLPQTNGAGAANVGPAPLPRSGRGGSQVQILPLPTNTCLNSLSNPAPLPAPITFFALASAKIAKGSALQNIACAASRHRCASAASIASMFKALGLIAYHHRDRGSIIGD